MKQSNILIQAAERAPFVDQSMSMNIYRKPLDTEESWTRLQLLAWLLGLKTGSYYTHVQSVNTAKKFSEIKQTNNTNITTATNAASDTTSNTTSNTTPDTTSDTTSVTTSVTTSDTTSVTTSDFPKSAMDILNEMEKEKNNETFLTKDSGVCEPGCFSCGA